MEKDNKKKITPEIDEALMMDIMADGVKKEGLTPPLEEHKPSPETLQEKSLIKERIRIKRGTDTDYEAIFFKKTHTNARDGKTVYIQPDFHEKLSRIVQVIGEDKLAIYAYLNNVLEYHFQEFGEQITKSFNEKYKPIL
ncbi:DUF3408 domain-containing protein [Flavobacterium humidisoli]|uniref:DUF3408 domain-containing protein n=1 Tax=Flavobacterium humidisoli TaxID=2937442 RepID=A0ABY4LV36_9FLAO|nr:DUF3408 domain-containing protein [Flavobacterium humidisoli]UPZ16213.1 DUF3408 domain-containing protein [Flavobacterium humidisoli]